MVVTPSRLHEKNDMGKKGTRSMALSFCCKRGMNRELMHKMKG